MTDRASDAYFAPVHFHRCLHGGGAYARAHGVLYVNGGEDFVDHGQQRYEEAATCALRSNAEPWRWALRLLQKTQGVRVCGERLMRNETSFFIATGEALGRAAAFPMLHQIRGRITGFLHIPAF